MNLKQKLMECVPPAYYADGTEAKCMIFKICNMFDIDSQSFKEVKEKKSMENSDVSFSENGTGKIKDSD